MYYSIIDPRDLETGLIDKEGFWIIRFRDPEKALSFRLRYNANSDTMMEFEIYDKGNLLGKGAQHCPNPMRWYQSFVIDGQFNVFLSKRHLRVV